VRETEARKEGGNKCVSLVWREREERREGDEGRREGKGDERTNGSFLFGGSIVLKDSSGTAPGTGYISTLPEFLMSMRTLLEGRKHRDGR